MELLFSFIVGALAMFVFKKINSHRLFVKYFGEVDPDGFSVLEKIHGELTRLSDARKEWEAFMSHNPTRSQIDDNMIHFDFEGISRRIGKMIFLAGEKGYNLESLFLSKTFSRGKKK